MGCIRKRHIDIEQLNLAKQNWTVGVEETSYGTYNIIDESFPPEHAKHIIGSFFETYIDAFIFLSGHWEGNLKKTNRAQREEDILFAFKNRTNLAPNQYWLCGPSISDGQLLQGVSHVSHNKVLNLVKKMHLNGKLERRMYFESYQGRPVWEYKIKGM